MKLPIRVFIIVLCAALILFIPFVVSSPSVIQEARDLWQEDTEEGDDWEELDFGYLFLSRALADEASENLATTEDVDLDDLLSPQKLSILEEWELPLDFSVPPLPDPERYTESGYEDQSIRVNIDTREIMESTVHIATVEIASPGQLRTATVAGVGSQRTDYIQSIATANHAVVAMNGDLFVEQGEGQKKTFEVRMTNVVTYDGKRNKTNRMKDVLTIDRNGDFHLFIKSEGLSDYIATHKGQTVNAYTFGPALVVNEEIPKLNKEYTYNPNRYDARSAIGQTGPLSYVMVVVESRGSSKGLTHQQLAELMLDLGCVQAYNLDGGNTAEMILMGPDPENPLFHVRGDQTAGDYRRHSDIIYFSTAVPEEGRE